MNEQNKELLLKDLSSRLSHGVFCVGITYELDDDGERYIPVKVKDTLTEIHNYKLETASVRLGLISSCKLETVKPYLRPMSSMTEEERKIYAKLLLLRKKERFMQNFYLLTLVEYMKIIIKRLITLMHIILIIED